MTQTELEQLSRDVAKKRGCEPYKAREFMVDGVRFDNDLWLHQDSAFCFELMVSEGFEVLVKKYNKISINDYPNHVVAVEYNQKHNNDTKQASRVAILRAYLAKGE